MKCRAGDLAIVIDAANSCNIGHVVTVVRPYDGPGGLGIDAAATPAWLVRCSVPMLWQMPGKKKYRRRLGSVLDAQLHPIRGGPTRRPRFVLISTSITSPPVRIELTDPLTLSGSHAVGRPGPDGR